MSFSASPENLARMAAQALRLDPPPTEAEIDEVLSRLAAGFGTTADATAEARRLLHSRFAIRMEMGQTLKTEHVPWLDARRGEIEPYYWNRYHEMLLRSGWPPLVAGTLDRSMDELLDLLGDPRDTGSLWKRRGLVVGDVQSGKTASYAALICKASDAGYRMVILLAGTLENVRRQTQERLDAAFVGLDSRDFLSREQLRHKTHVGVGLINSQRDGIVFTSRDRDFREGIATSLNISLNAVKEPVMVVAKKNRRVLSNLAAWLRVRNANVQGKIDLPLLLIDDEADNASINTRLNPNETTAINQAIRDLLALFTRSGYVGFTATPFANIFIDPTSTNDMLGDDLFPRDFIHLLEPPTNYVGMDRMFPPTDPDQLGAGDAEAWAAGLRTIDDSDHWLPIAHKQDVPEAPLPASLLKAVRYFLLSCAVRDTRISARVENQEKVIHRSMLVNVSRFTAVQNRVANQIHVELERIRQHVRLYGSLEPEVASERSAEIGELKKVFNEELSALGFSWGEVLAALFDAISPIRVQPVNQSTGAASLDFSAVTAPPGVRVIAVGGNSLSRGLTLEGLCVSYFLRNSKAYDTLLQMGRWFGYRDGYHDVCRLWLSADAEGWYRHVAEATNELKRDFSRMRRQKATPVEFGLRVRTHPDTLLITARNKMATGITLVEEVRDISLAGHGIETSRLHADRGRNESNFRTVDRFLTELVAKNGQPSQSSGENAFIWRDVPAELIGTLLREFLVHPLNHDFQGEAIAAKLGDGEQWTDWTVALPNKGDEKAVTPPLSAGLAVDAKRRNVLLRDTPPRSLLVSGKKARVGSRTDVRLGMTQDQIVAAEGGRASKDVSEGDYRAAMTKPLLIIYLLRGRTQGGHYEGGLVLPALGLHFPGTKDPNAPTRLFQYRLNKVAQGELELDGDDLAPDADED